MRYLFNCHFGRATQWSASLLSWCLSVICPSVTLVIHAQTVQDIEIHFTPKYTSHHDTRMFLVSWGQIL